MVGFLQKPRGQDSWYGTPTKREQGSHTLPGMEGGSPLDTCSTRLPPQAPAPCSELTWSGVNRDVAAMAGQWTQSAPADALRRGLGDVWVGTTCRPGWRRAHPAFTKPALRASRTLPPAVGPSATRGSQVRTRFLAQARSGPKRQACDWTVAV